MKNNQKHSAEEEVKDQVPESTEEENKEPTDGKLSQETDRETVEEPEELAETQDQADLLAEELASARANIQELEDRNLRLNAEFDNFRKRSRREKEESYLFAKLDLVKDFLPLLDALDRAKDQYSKMEDEAQQNMLEGIEMLIKQGQDCLAKLGIEEITCEGEQFDPNFHEAIQHVEDEQYGENVVIECLLKGYRSGDNVVRHSVVRVAN